MRILFTSDYLDPDNIGGCGRVIMELVTRLAVSGHDVTVLAGLDHDVPDHREVGSSRIRWQAFPYETGRGRGIGFFVRTRRRIRDAFRELGDCFDVVVHNQPFTASAIGPVSVPCVYMFHSPWPLEYLADRFGVEDIDGARGHGARARIDVSMRRHVESRALRRVHRVVTLSKTMSQHARNIHGVPGSIIRVVPGGVDLDRFSPVANERRQQLRERWDSTGDQFIVSCVRRLVSRTGVDLLLDAIACADPTLANVRLLIAGKGPDRDLLMKSCQRRGLSERSSFLGYVPDDDLADLYRASDLTIVPTRALEGFGLSTLEALASGTPVAATPVGGSVEILSPLHQALLAPEVSAVGVRQVLKHWCTHPKELERLRGRTRSYVEANYSWDRMANSLLEVLEEVAVLVPA